MRFATYKEEQEKLILNFKEQYIFNSANTTGPTSTFVYCQFKISLSKHTSKINIHARYKREVCLSYAPEGP